ncbi:MAG: ADP-forming succinate--CoA ligase subunit beta [Deltaproteobacteria bacterium]
MNLLEYQAKDILAKAGISVPAGIVIDDRMDVRMVFSYLGIYEGVLKTQVPAGGRGISGGIKIVHSAKEAEAAAKRLIGNRLVTPQTGSNGNVVRKVLFEEMVSVEKEYYLGIAVDRSLGVPVIISSPEGGKSIEELAKLAPEKIYREPVDPLKGLTAFRAIEMASSIGLRGEEAQGFARIITTLFENFLKLDALLIEINPLVLTGGRFVALDAKITIDDNALFRHPDLSSIREAEEALEREVRVAGVNYVRLDGDVGCLANGAGLAMATMDMIKLAGREPANFLDIGGSAHHKQVSSALRILFSDPKVRVVFVNIFGGMIHCDLIASEIIEAVGSLNPEFPIIVRLEGTDAEKGKRIIADSGLPIMMVADMEEGMERIGNL